jgi:homoserine kinase
MSGAVRVRVPATSANLGSGFDSLGLALALYDEVEASLADDGVVVSVQGVGAGELPADERHLVARAAYTAFDALGTRPAGLRLRCVNRIPQARGLGSSAAAIVAGVLAARALVSNGAQRLGAAGTLALCAELEGHADNVAACLLGGATIAWCQDGTFKATRLEPVDGLRAWVFVPGDRSETAQSRQLLPESVPHADAAHAAGRAALLVRALTGAPELLLPATEDRLHQPYRKSVMPESIELVTRLRAAGAAAVISGAGPTVLSLDTNEPGDDTVVRDSPAGWVVQRLDVDRSGAAYR